MLHFQNNNFVLFLQLYGSFITPFLIETSLQIKMLTPSIPF